MASLHRKLDQRRVKEWEVRPELPEFSSSVVITFWREAIVAGDGGGVPFQDEIWENTEVAWDVWV